MYGHHGTWRSTNYIREIRGQRITMYFLSEDKHVDKHARVIITKMVRKKNKQKHKVNVSILLVLQKYRHHCPIVHPISCSETTEKRKRKARGEGTGSALAQTRSPEPDFYPSSGRNLLIYLPLYNSHAISWPNETGWAWAAGPSTGAPGSTLEASLDRVAGYC